MYASLQAVFTEMGIRHETSVPYYHESNRVAGKFKGIIQEMARTAGVTSKLSPSL